MTETEDQTPLIDKSINYHPQSELQPIPLQQKQRLQSLDVFRGLTIVGMILVDNQAGSGYWPFVESQWEGLRPSDCVFPSFLFIVGVAISLALKNENPRQWKTWFRILRRTLILFTVGVFFNLFASRFHFSGWRIPGVLQRIAFCYLIAATLHLTMSLLFQWIVVFGLVGIYLGLMYGLDVPGCGRGVLTPQCNAGAYIDQHIFGKNWMIWPNDPEGILSTLTSILTTYLGYLYGRVLVCFHRNPKQVVPMWLFLDGMIIGPALITSAFIPLIKKIWSLSFALMTGGIAGTLLTICFVVVDGIKWHNFPRGNKICHILIAPLLWLGMNSLLIFMLMILFEILLLDIIKVQEQNNSSISLWTWLFRNLYSSWIKDPNLASLIFSFTHLAIWIAVAGLCYWRKWFLKI